MTRSRSEAGATGREGLTEHLDPAREMEVMRRSLSEHGIALDEQGLIAEGLTDAQVETLAKWREATMEESIEMPDERTFYRKVFLAVSLWRQQQESGSINYLLGKGAGVEIALRGTIAGRKKRDVTFSYRGHSDFELYAVRYDAAENGADLGGGRKVYTPEFRRVFGSQEYFPLTATKGLKGLPPDLLHRTHEVVELGGVDVLVPELELMYLDKRFARESTPRPEGFDDELLARQYVLDTEKIMGYIDAYVVPRVLKGIEQRYAPKMASAQMMGIKKYLSLYEREHELLRRTEPQDWCDELNEILTPGNGSETSFLNMSSAYWIRLTPADFTPDRQIADEPGLLARVQEHMAEKKAAALESIEEMRKQERAFLESI